MNVTKEDVEKAKADYEAQWTVAYRAATSACDKAWDKYWDLKQEYEANERRV